MSDGDRNEPAPDVLRFIRSLDGDPSPAGLDEEVNEAAVLERLRLLGESSDDARTAQTPGREQWIGHVLCCLNHGGVDHESLPGTSSLGLLLAAVATAAVAQDDLEPSERELLEQAVREAATAGARAWARVDQARCLLSSIEGGAS